MSEIRERLFDLRNLTECEVDLIATAIGLMHSALSEDVSNAARAVALAKRILLAHDANVAEVNELARKVNVTVNETLAPLPESEPEDRPSERLALAALKLSDVRALMNAATVGMITFATLSGVMSREDAAANGARGIRALRRVFEAGYTAEDWNALILRYTKLIEKTWPGETIGFAHADVP